ncbi:hypothetical protein [Mycobacterium sp. GA-1841]|uniref:hypothetical protein n=1 Tax=Mycobacterium sp. GA-1841 TaxID=1834154 RepID=UPI0011155B44|nr:hypothetical protein [Mycobacterium sp. GA-1841]
MTAAIQLRRQDDAWAVGPTDPSIAPERVQDNSFEVSRFGDDRWDLAPLGGIPSVRKGVIIWAPFPARTRETFRRAAWLAINTPTPSILLEKQGASAVEWSSSGSILKLVTYRWLRFAKWLDEKGIDRLCDLTRSDLESYALYNQAGEHNAQTKSTFLRSITQLWAYATELPASDALQIPPWEDEPLGDFVPTRQRTSENKTPIIHPSTMAPLLLWAQHMMDFAVDIHTATRHWQSLLDQMPRTKSRQGRAAAATLVQSWADNGITTLPGTPRQPGNLNYQYLAATHGGMSPLDLSRMVQESGIAFVGDPDAPTPIDTPITATVDGKPWCDAINQADLLALRQSVLGAALVIVAYLTGMRPHEVLALQPNCCVRQRISPTIVRYTINGRAYKRVRKDGRADPDGTQRSWTTIAPVARAIATAEQFFPDNTVLFAAAKDATTPVSTSRAPLRISRFIQTANSICEHLDLPKAYQIPDDPAGPVSLGRFRRTLAWHIRRLPHGTVALAIQYGHLSVLQGEGYSGLATAGFAALMDQEEVSALIDNIEQTRRELTNGARVSGPAAGRLIELVSRDVRFEGTYLTDKDVRRIKADTTLTLYDNPQSYLTCMFDPSRALCHSDKASAHTFEPRLDKCQRNCPNIARTDRQIAGLQTEVSRLRGEATSPLTPKPLSLRLHDRADALATIIDKHHDTAIKPSPSAYPDHETTGQ